MLILNHWIALQIAQSQLPLSNMSLNHPIVVEADKFRFKKDFEVESD